MAKKNNFVSKIKKRREELAKAAKKKAEFVDTLKKRKAVSEKVSKTFETPIAVRDSAKLADKRTLFRGVKGEEPVMGTIGRRETWAWNGSSCVLAQNGPFNSKAECQREMQSAIIGDVAKRQGELTETDVKIAESNIKALEERAKKGEITQEALEEAKRVQQEALDRTERIQQAKARGEASIALEDFKEAQAEEEKDLEQQIEEAQRLKAQKLRQQEEIFNRRTQAEALSAQAAGQVTPTPARAIEAGRLSEVRAREAEIFDDKIAQTRRLLARAQQEGLIQEEQRLSNELTALEEEKLKKEQQELTAKSENFTNALEVFNKMPASALSQLGEEGITSFFSSFGAEIDPLAASGLSASAKSILEDKQLTDEEKQLRLDQLRANLEESKMSDIDKVIKNIEAIDQAVSRGEISNEAAESLKQSLGISEKPLSRLEQLKIREQELKNEVREIEAKEKAAEIVGEATIINKGQNNPYLGKEGGSLTFRTNNPGAITAPAGNTKKANELAIKFGAIPGLYSLDANGGLVLNFSSEEAGDRAMQQLLDEAYSGLTLDQVAEKWTGGKGAGHKAAMQERGLGLNEVFGTLTDEDKQAVVASIKQVEAGPRSRGETVTPTATIKKPVSRQLKSKIRSFVQSRSGIGDKDARLQAEKDIEEEIVSGRASTPVEAKLNLGIVSDEDREVKKRISEEIKNPRKDTEEILRNVDNIIKLSEIEGGIGDTASVTAFLKTIDPGSVARESEVEGVENARGLIDGVSVWFDKLSKGSRLSENQKEQLRDTSNILGKLARGKMYELLITRKQELLDRGVEPTVISDFQINKLERELGEEETARIRRENGILTQLEKDEQLIYGDDSQGATITLDEDEEIDSIFN